MKKTFERLAAVVLILATLFAFAGCSSTGAATVQEFAVNEGVLTSYNGKGGDIVIPSKVTTIGDNVFRENDTITSVKLPERLESIEFGAFRYCTNLKSIEFPETLTSIGDSAFYGSGLQSVEINEGVTTIGNFAFAYCADLKSVSIPTTIEYLGSYSFNGCGVLSEVDLPDTITSGYGKESFVGTPFLGDNNGMLVRDGVLLSYQGEETTVTIPAGVKAIGPSAFAGTSVDTIIGLESVDEIDPTALMGTPWLNSLGEFAVVGGILFQYSGEGGDVVIPSDCVEINDDVFYKNTKITTVTIPASVKTIGEDAFKQCKNLEKVTIQGNDVTIASGAFQDCSALKTVTFGGSVNIGKSAFKGDDVLAAVTITGGTLGEGAFDKCAGITSVSISGVKTIARNTFRECAAIEKLTIGAGVEEIAQDAFKRCTNIAGALELPDGLKKIGRTAFTGCVSITSVTLPSTTTEVAKGAFQDCTALTTVNNNAPDATIANDAFAGTPYGA